MNYEKAYKDALKRAKLSRLQLLDIGEEATEIEYIFPELKECEDERLRKTTISFLKEFADKGYENAVECIDWLEKQSEQKYTDKVKPKFHEGDWIVYKNDICQIVKHEEGCNKLVTTFGIEKELVNERNLSTARLWTIADAKDGDVLVSKHNKPFIYNGIFDEEYVGAYCGIDYLGNYFLEDIFPCNWSYKEGVKPTTKEQREILFQKMKEAGYEWDDNKKKLKKIEDDTENYKTGLNFSKTEYNIRNRWKPSKEQIIALRWILNNIPYNKHKEEISGLLDQIKVL